MARLTKMIVAIFALLLPLLLPAQNGRFSLFDVSPFTGSVIMIQWKVPPLSDFSYYEVERSMDTVNWTRIARVNKNSADEYLITDSNPVNGRVYYRIRQVTRQQSSLLSVVKWVQVNKSDRIYIWPNPVKDVLHVRTPFSNGSIEILDPAGKLIIKTEIANPVMDIFTGLLPGGLYFMRIANGKRIITEKFIKD